MENKRSQSCERKVRVVKSLSTSEVKKSKEALNNASRVRAQVYSRLVTKYGRDPVITEELARDTIDLYDELMFSGAVNDIFRQYSSRITVELSERREGRAIECKPKRYLNSNTGTEFTRFTCDISLPLVQRSATLNKTFLLQFMDRIERAMMESLVNLYITSIEPPKGLGGIIYQCDIERCTIELSDKFLPSSKMTSSPLNIPGYRNIENSCYLDSLLMILFFSPTDFWKRGILESDIVSTNYTGRECDLINPSDPKTLVKLAARVRSVLRTDYNRLVSREVGVVCTDLRKLLATCVRDLRVNNRYTIFNDRDIYTALTDLFKDTKITIPYSSVIKANNVSEVRVSSIDIRDYFASYTTETPSLMADLINSEVLVFYNGGSPRVKNFTSVGEESGEIKLDNFSYPYTIEKSRVLGPIILEGRYRLIGVVTLQGVPRDGEGGKHYTSHFLSKSADNTETWYKYDDLKGFATPIGNIDSLPESGVWKESSGNMPSMFFYQHI